MSEEILNTNQTETADSRWNDIEEDTKWLEQQAEIATEKGDEATLQKIGKYLEQNQKIMQILNGETAEETAEETIETTDAIITDATETQSEAQQEQSKAYEREFINPDGTIVNISADTQEEFKEKVAEQNAANLDKLR